MIFALIGITSTPELNALLIGIFVPIIGVLSPLLIARQLNKNQRALKEQDWNRQDEVAAKAKTIAEEAVEHAKHASEKADRNADLIAESSKETNSQLKRIHALVNSQMTEAIQNELAAIQETVDMMHELVETNRKNGIEPTIEISAALKGRERRIKEIEDVLKVRRAKDAETKLN